MMEWKVKRESQVVENVNFEIYNAANPFPINNENRAGPPDTFTVFTFWKSLQRFERMGPHVRGIAWK